MQSLAKAKAGTKTACGRFLLVKKLTCPKRIHEGKYLDHNDKRWIQDKRKMKNCANCGQLIAKDGGYKGFLHTYRAFCCKDCYKAYKEKYKWFTRWERIKLSFVICFFIILLIIFFESGKSNKKNDNGNNGSMTEQVRE